VPEGGERICQGRRAVCQTAGWRKQRRCVFKGKKFPPPAEKMGRDASSRKKRVHDLSSGEGPHWWGEKQYPPRAAIKVQ